MTFNNLIWIDTVRPIGIHAKVLFGECELSIIKNEVSYGGLHGLYEIAVFKNDNMVELPGITEKGDTVKGFLTEDDVDAIIKKMHLVTGIEPIMVQ
tara:strand:- start:1018 stop:1305 length:288 start_codon:yes stop_codon:yes gene_type:complete